LLLCLIGAPWAWAYFKIFILLPWRFRKASPLRLAPEFEETRADELTPDVRRRLGQLVSQFSAEGFPVAANLHSGGGVPGVRSFEVVLVNQSRRQIGSVIAAGADSGRGDRRHAAGTSTRRPPSAVDRPGGGAAAELSGLVQVHRSRVGAVQPSRNAVPPLLAKAVADAAMRHLFADMMASSRVPRVQPMATLFG
jgi:hypothetical protein